MCTYHIVSHQSDTILCFRWENSVWKAIQSSFSFSSSKSFRLFVLGPQSESWRWQIRFRKQKNLYFLVTLMVRRDGVSMTRRLVVVFPFATLPSHDLDESSFENQIFVYPLTDDIEIHDSSRVESLSMETNDSQSENEFLLNMKSHHRRL